MTKVLVIALISVLLAGCGGVVLSSETAPNAGDPAFLNYGLPRAYFPITIKRDKPNYGLSVTLDKKDIIYARDPDPKYNYRLVQHHKWYTNDTLVVQTDGGGLLAGINASSENQAVAIVNQALVLTTQLATLKESRTCDAKQFSITYLLDPLNPEDVERLNRVLKEDACVHLSVEPLEKVSDGLTHCSDCTRGNGVFYRVQRAYELNIADTTGATHGMSAVFNAPDVDHTYYMPLERKWFVKFDVKLAFDKGVLTKFDSSNPSQALAALQLPVDVIKNILGLSTASSSSTVSKGR